MASGTRRKFSSISDWYNFVEELLSHQPPSDINLYDLRCAVYQEIEQIRKRPLYVYAVRFPDAHPLAPTSIEQQDVDGFTDLINATAPAAEAVDVLIHSPGGSPEATERIVGLLRSRFKDVQFMVPHTAYSAATMLALSGNEVLLHPTATLGPIDPQINGTPARSIRRGFDKVRELLRVEGPEALPAYLPLIEKHSLELLEICDDSLKLSKELVTEWLTSYMFGGKDAKEQIDRAVDYFSDYDAHKTHSRPLTFDKVAHLGLKISLADSPLRELMREAYILLYGFFSLSPFVKVFENSSGLTWGRQFQVLPPVSTTPQQQSSQM